MLYALYMGSPTGHSNHCTFLNSLGSITSIYLSIHRTIYLSICLNLHLFIIKPLTVVSVLSWHPNIINIFTDKEKFLDIPSEDMESFYCSVTTLVSNQVRQDMLNPLQHRNFLTKKGHHGFNSVLLLTIILTKQSGFRGVGWRWGVGVRGIASSRLLRPKNTYCMNCFIIVTRVFN